MINLLYLFSFLCSAFAAVMLIHEHCIRNEKHEHCITNKKILFWLNGKLFMIKYEFRMTERN